MAITKEQLDHLAKLCRIALSDEEKTRLGGQLNQIIEFVEQLQACDVEGIEPMAHPQEGVTLKPRRIENKAHTEGDLSASAEEIATSKKFLKNVQHPVTNGQIEVRSSLS
ncbi:Asp-tRNA(Asn)/Glu-tRNA(Gln) amidotransferase subunit GatC [Patescibacteria group bacterium]|nr:Asp-tRNA(Asn)/Glu-tRNA(Gln) amidotransferase subunit GatC [Patescibacteria group bacterium]